MRQEMEAKTRVGEGRHLAGGPPAEDFNVWCEIRRMNSRPEGYEFSLRGLPLRFWGAAWLRVKSAKADFVPFQQRF